MLTSTMTVNEDAEILERYKEINPHLLTVVWGSHPTFLPKQTLSRTGIDVAVRGEGDWVIRDLAIKYFSGEDWRLLPGNRLSFGRRSRRQFALSSHRQPR